MKITASDKLLRVAVKSIILSKSFPVKQEQLICPECKVAIDIEDPCVRVEFHKIEAGGRPFVVAEPTCPRCLIKVKPVTYVNN